MKIDNLELKNNYFLAPMSGVSDFPFREIVKKYEPGLVFSEMIASRALIEKNKKTMKMLKKDSNNFYAIQIAGCEASVMSSAAKICEDMGADIIDINMGCPVKKVVNGHAGSALMKDEFLAYSIIDSVVNAVKIPVTLKMRKGWDEHNLNAPDIAKKAEDLGIKMITIHGRTRCQMFKGQADWTFINKVKKNVNIPVIANGDIVDNSDVKKSLIESNADGIMIGRGSYGKPWIFEKIRAFFDNSLYEISLDKKKEIILEHFELNMAHYENEVGLKNFRKHLCWYSKSLKNSNEFRNQVNNCLDPRKIKIHIKNFFS